MRYLAFDCCFGACSAAVLEHTSGSPGPDIALAGCFEVRRSGHAERLVPMLAQVMGRAQASFADLSAIAVTNGPGTFTGIRTGIAAARGLALATALPVYTTTSLALIANGARRRLGAELVDRDLVICLDARQGLVYTQTFRGGDGSATTATQMARLDAAVAALTERPITAVGSGAAQFVAAARSAGCSAVVGRLAMEPDARDMTWRHLAQTCPPLPLYLRPHDARPQTGQSLPRHSP